MLINIIKGMTPLGNAICGVAIPRGYSDGYKRHTNTSKCPYWYCNAKRVVF